MAEQRDPYLRGRAYERSRILTLLRRLQGEYDPPHGGYDVGVRDALAEAIQSITNVPVNVDGDMEPVRERLERDDDEDMDNNRGRA